MLLFHVRPCNSCFETLNGPVSISTVLTQTTMSLYDTLNLNSIGITSMAQFLSYIRSKLYQQYNPGVHIL